MIICIIIMLSVIYWSNACLRRLSRAKQNSKGVSIQTSWLTRTSQIYFGMLALKIKPTKPRRVNSCNSSLRSLHIACSVFGISYFAEFSSLPSRILHIAFTLLHFGIFVCSFMYSISYVAPKFCKSDAVSQSVMGIHQILAIIAVIAIYYQILFHKGSGKKLLDHLSAVENGFSALNIAFPSKRFVTKMLIELLVLVGFVYASFIFFVIYYEVRHITVMLLELVSTIHPLLVIILNLMTFANFAWLIRDGFGILRRTLMDMCAIDSSKQVKTLRAAPLALWRDFKNLAHIYEQLFAMVNYQNDIFGLSNLASMGKSTWNNSHNCQLNSELLAALFSISLTCNLFALFKILTETTNNMNNIQFDVLGTCCECRICHDLIESNGLNYALNLTQLQSYG